MGLGRAASAARRELVEIGKPAIPAFLNLIVDHKSLEDPENRQIINVAVQGLRDITLQDMGFAPGAAIGGLATDESMKANQQALQRWFGWWRDHKETWTVPEPEPVDEEDFCAIVDFYVGLET